MSDDDLEWTRRTFLERAARMGLGAGVAGWAAACREPNTGPPDAAGDGGVDARDTADTAVDARDTGGDAADARDVGEFRDMTDVREVYGEISKPPFVQVQPDGLLLRFETHTRAPLDVRLEPKGGTGREKQAATSTRQVDYRWPPEPDSPVEPENPDLPGTYTVQQVPFQNLEPGREYTWIIHVGEGKQVEGTFTAPPPKGAEFSMGYLADTMSPKNAKVGRLLADRNPDVTLHGGDIQYQSAIFVQADTYVDLFNSLADVMATGPAHFCIGNHEREGDGEFELFYRRLFAARRDGEPTHYHAFTYGGVRFLVLNSENDFEAGTEQYKRVERELQAVRDDDALQSAVVAFHRPFFTFSKSSPDFGTRDTFHPLFKKYDVPLVLTGHNHCYERFEADGVTYIVDGGGGAAPYSPDYNREEVLNERPADEGRRKASEQSHGAVDATFRADGTIDVRRTNIDGMVTDEFTAGV